MKRLRKASCALILALAATACGGGPAKRQHQTQQTAAHLQTIHLGNAFFEEGATDTIRFGHLYSGEMARLQFRIANESDRTTAIDAYERTCGCTTLEYSREPIAPGTARDIGICFDSRGTRGWQLKTVEISLSGSRKPLRILVEATVE